MRLPEVDPDWDKCHPYITRAEAMCRCGKCGIESADKMSPEFLDILLDLRTVCGFPFLFGSLYRCPDHPAEKQKEVPGTHSMGLAADIVCYNDWAFRLIQAASAHPKIKAIRLAQKGPTGSRFVHIDMHDRGFYHVGSY